MIKLPENVDLDAWVAQAEAIVKEAMLLVLGGAASVKCECTVSDKWSK